MEPNPAQAGEPQAAAPPAPRAATHRPLPPVGSFLSDVFSLGFRSLLPALPAITLLCFYRFGMGLYLEFAADRSSALGLPDQRAAAAHMILTVSAYLPLLVLVYTPFLPLQDALIRGGRKSFLDSIRHVLERMVPFGLSSVAQLVILMGPILVMALIAAAAISSVPEAPKEVIMGIVMLFLLPVLGWVAIAGLFMIFGTPALILDGYGPIQSLTFSVREVAGHFFGVIGRLFAGFGVIVVAAVFAAFPASILRMAAAAAGIHSPPLTIAQVFWTSVVYAVAFPFSVAVLTTLYRAVAPGLAIEASPPMEIPPTVGEPHQAETPFVFE